MLRFLKAILAALARAGSAIAGAATGAAAAIWDWTEDLIEEAPLRVWGAASHTSDAVLGGAGRLLSGAVHVAAEAADTVLAAPRALLGGLFGGGGQPVATHTPQQAAADEQRRQAARDRADDISSLAASIRAVASARARGAAAPEDHIVQLAHRAPKLLRWVQALDADECQVAAALTTAALRGVIDRGEAPRGLRTPAQVSEVLLAAAGHASERPTGDRRAILRAACQGAARQPRTAEAIAGEYEARAAA